LKVRLGFLYGILVALLVIMGAWWVYFLSNESKAQSEYRLQKLVNDQIHASFLVQSDERVRAEPEKWLGDSFPDLIFRRSDGGVVVEVDPAVVKEIQDEVRNTRRMFLYEGLFFLVLLTAGSSILIHAWRSEVKFKQARELFLAGATHEFKTPLASLRLYTETLGRQGLGEADVRRIHGRMLDDIHRLEGLVDDVLSTSAVDVFRQGPPVVLDLAEECRLVLEDLERFAADNRARFNLQAEPGSCIRGHRATLGLALRNLLVNAVRHSPAPVTVDVAVQAGRKEHRLVVRDDGPGIPRRLHEKVFECFYSGKQDGRSVGTGLGLYLVKRNIENLGGRVELDSARGLGCEFTLVLPAVPPQDAARAGDV